jgi:uncharacterized membrane protein YeaQ/YmgE (transglycosylase-associated protein family)
MRMLVVVAVGLIVGIVAGLLLSELVGVVGFLLFDDPAGVRFLPVVLGIVGAVALPVLAAWSRRVSRQPSHHRNRRSKA